MSTEPEPTTVVEPLRPSLGQIRDGEGAPFLLRRGEARQRSGLARLGVAAGLPPEMLDEAVHRVGWLACTVGILALLATILPIAQPHLQAERLELRTWIMIPLFLLSAAIAYSALHRWIPPWRVLPLAAAYQIAICWAFAAFVNVQPWPSVLLPGWSPVAMVMLVMPLVVPSTSARTLVTSMVCAVLDPLTLFCWAGMGLVHLPDLDLQLLRFGPSIAAIPVSVLASRLVHRLGERIARAQDMGSYHLIERVGTVGMGEVWRASHDRLAREAAVKLIRPEVLAGASGAEATMAAERFEREARAIAALRSPHTVQVYDSGTAADGTLFYVMELLDGVDLETLVRTDGPQPPERVIHILRQACHSLREAHARGLVHRDVKPANMMLCRYGEDLDHVKVLDFGLVRERLSSSVFHTAENAVAGTPAYLAPEIATGSHPVDGRTDLYALGCVAYFLLTGTLVFEGRSAMQLAVAHATEVPVAPSVRSSLALPAELERIVMRCLEKDPQRRPRGAVELDQELAAVAVTRPWSPARAGAWWSERADERARADRSERL